MKPTAMISRGLKSPSGKSLLKGNGSFPSERIIEFHGCDKFSHMLDEESEKMENWC